ncbi:hypothetical protein AJ80_09576 [Polytolypa hystricis UAMH7299]|uniref:Subtelomeric hrmA-associated cluster protein AFUB-079030/YDR124W-like helical bundle domain-containing protein n=1 Tax=Polytolypa hystricis (strain UAMH7299) TaxID=1447883 RepID=A0A2B7WNR5_POLH7|nr:hypothetical protein AJ80_09576 [Polytolypa hystricis UAMH7299]
MHLQVFSPIQGSVAKPIIIHVLTVSSTDKLPRDEAPQHNTRQNIQRNMEATIETASGTAERDLSQIPEIEEVVEALKTSGWFAFVTGWTGPQDYQTPFFMRDMDHICLNGPDTFGSNSLEVSYQWTEGGNAPTSVPFGSITIKPAFNYQWPTKTDESERKVLAFLQLECMGEHVPKRFADSLLKEPGGLYDTAPSWNRQRLTPTPEISTPEDLVESELPTEAWQLEIGDREALDTYYRIALHKFQQLNCRQLAKAYIKMIEPRKHVKYPYNGGKERDPEKTKPA